MNETDYFDSNAEAERMLKKLSCTVYFRHPEVGKDLPCVSFYTLNEQGVFAADNDETITGVRVQADVWAKKASECGKISAELVSLARADGWRRLDCIDLGKTDDVYHKSVTLYKEFVI